MTDWNKLKVNELKAELKSRGLPQTGLKAALVARLEEAETQDGGESSEAPGADLNGDGVEVEESSEVIQAPAQSDAEPLETSQPPAAEADAPAPDSNSTVVVPPSETVPSEATLTPDPEPSEQPAQEIVAPQEPPVQSEVAKQSPEPATVSNGTADNAVKPSMSISPLPVSKQEVVEDQNTRKRRSRTPPLVAEEVAIKRAKVEDNESNEENKTLPSNDGPTQFEGGHEAPHAQLGADVKMQEDENVQQDIPGADSAAQHTQANEDDSRPKDARFKQLFAPSKLEEQPISEAMDASTHTVVAPAVHPATNSLYIKDFMRPLNPAALKDHIVFLATAPGTTTDHSILVDFFLDPIRTHAFVVLKTVSMASRVRAELHERIWPDERTRKPLWVDFVPEEKVTAWIEEERAGGPRSSKKWEVIYEEDRDENIIAILQEAGTTPAQRTRPSAPPGASSRSRPDNPAPAPPPTADSHEKSTIATPVLMYTPVPKELAYRRLDNMDTVTRRDYSSQTKSHDINRYTFEDGDKLVDRGPEIFPGIRPPVRGGRGGFRGRGDRYNARGPYRDNGRDDNRHWRDREFRDRRY